MANTANAQNSVFICTKQLKLGGALPQCRIARFKPVIANCFLHVVTKPLRDKYICFSVCTYICMYVRTYVCMCICLYYVYIFVLVVLCYLLARFIKYIGCIQS
jgi:hypothetical protein